jgi:hypothetical protein
MRLLPILVLAVPLLAQPVRPFRDAPGPGGVRPQERRRERLERMQENGTLGRRLMQIRMNRIQEVLNLPEDKARAIAERWDRYDRDFMERARRIGDLRGRFSQILMAPGGEEDKNARIKPLLEQFMDLRRQQADLKKAFEDDIRGQLPPAQQVRLIILVDELQQRIREALRESLGGGPQPGRPE